LKTPACFKTAKSRRHLGPPANRCASIHASVALLALTGINLIGRLQSKRAQLTFTALEVIAVLTVIVAGGNFGLRLSPPRSDASSPLPRSALPADADRVLSHLLWMLYSSVAYAGVGALVGIAVLLAGTALGLIRSRLPQVASSQSWSPRRQSLTCERAARFERTR
jgi:basic amino acid/polyamine antiporter, APA family